MAEATRNGDWSAWVVNGGLRVAYKNKMVKKSDQPQDVVDYFTAMLSEQLAPSEEFVAEQANPQVAEARKIEIQEDAQAATPEDFADEEPTPEQIAQAATFPAQPPVPAAPAAPLSTAPVAHEVTAATAPAPVQAPSFAPPVAPLQPVAAPGFYPPQPAPAIEPVIQQPPFMPPQLGLVSAPPMHPSEMAYQEGYTAGINAQQPMPAGDGFSIFDAPLEDIARALYERFNVYTVFLKRPPEGDEVSSITGMPLSNYDRGLAYQAFRRAEAQGLFEGMNQRFADQKVENDNSRAVNTAYLAGAPVQPVDPYSAPRDSFAFRTSPEHTLHPNGMASRVNPEDDSDPIAEPPMRQTMINPIIRPNW